MAADREVQTLVSERKLPKTVYYRCYAAVAVNAMINNMGFCVITAASQNLAAIFHTEDLMVFESPPLSLPLPSAVLVGAALTTTLTTIITATLTLRSMTQRILQTAFNLILLVGCTASTVLNAQFLIKYSAKSRVYGVLVLTTSSYGLLAVSSAFNNGMGFVIALGGTVCAGACQSIGEVTNLAFLKQVHCVV